MLEELTGETAESFQKGFLSFDILNYRTIADLRNYRTQLTVSKLTDLPILSQGISAIQDFVCLHPHLDANPTTTTNPLKSVNL